MDIKTLSALVLQEWVRIEKNNKSETELVKQDTDSFLCGSHENPLKQKIERESCFFTEPEVTTPAENFIYN
jgi:hypothetical protein